MDYPIAIVVIISLTVVGAVALLYGTKKRAGNFFELTKTDNEIRQWRERQYGLKILKKRLEKGEITKEEYDELKNQFQGPSNPKP